MNPTSHPEAAAVRHLWFRRGPIRFALPLSELVEVNALESLRPLPLAVEALTGFVHYRGRVVPVFDPLPLAGQASEPPRLPTFAAFASINHEPALALLLDEVGRMVPVRFDHQLPMSSGVPEAIQGVGKLEDNQVVIALNVRELGRVMGLQGVMN
jgi:chemotaxis signal transduction protein